MQLALIPLSRRWSGGAMVLDKLSVPGRPLIWITLGKGYTALAVGAGGRVLSRISFLSSFSLSLEVGPKQTEILSQRAAKPKKQRIKSFIQDFELLTGSPQAYILFFCFSLVYFLTISCQ